ncbi:glycosyltransferase family 39 protein [Coleofasciculus chthonoplastes]|uniref:glycosyltransferase family 39 protein n=1 Tax=Coleofasciculus chthonoplastes TaxID=64178 RepID=UPI0032F6ECF0
MIYNLTTGYKSKIFNSFRLNWQNIIKVFIVFAIIIGIILRFANLENKVFNWDEVRSFYRLSGYVREEVIDKIFTGDIITAQDIQKYQTPSPEKNLVDAVFALSNNPEHPPLFYLMARFWMHLFNSPFSVRVLAVILGILSLVPLYWLCCELFGSPLVALVALTLFSISPYQILLSQAAREYSLWTLMTILSSATLLHSLRTRKTMSWIAYTITIIGGLYSHLFFAITLLGQVVYTVSTKGWHCSKNLLKYSLSLLIAILFFLPWTFMILTNHKKLQKVTAWTREFESGFKKIIQENINNVGDIFIDFNGNTRLEYYLSIIIFSLFVYSIYRVCKSRKKNKWLFLVLLIFPSWLLLILPDLISEVGVRSLQSRYLVTSYLGIQISVSYLVGAGLQLKNDALRLGSHLLLVTLISLGVISGVLITQSQDWDYLELKGTPISENLEIAPILNKNKQPLVISDSTHSYLLSLSYLIDDHVRFQLLKENDLNQWNNKLIMPKWKNQFSDIFIYYPRQELLDFLVNKYPRFQIKKIHKGLLKVVKI